MTAVLRVKRKASCEPVEGLVVAVKKTKSDIKVGTNEVLFKFASTLKSETESVKDHIQAALSKEKSVKFSQWRDPKTTSQKTVHEICDKLKAEHRVENCKKKLELLNNRRLILTETVPIVEDVASQSTEVRKLFQLYDIIEEIEDPKKQQVEELESIITCNDEPLIREKASDYVYDVYIADVGIDDSFMQNTVSLRPCSLTQEDIYSGGSSDSEEECDDDDDSNDENNWRNDYPDESNSERSSEDSDAYDIYGREMMQALNHFNIDEEDDSDEGKPFDYARILKELREQSDDTENESSDYEN